MSDHPLTRRDFVAVSAAGAAALTLRHPGPNLPDPPMPERSLGRTGHRVRLFSLGGQATLERPGRHDDAVAIINRAIDLGVNYIDTAAAYGRGISQIYIGDVMKTRRAEVFLATKTHDRTREGSLRLLDDSLRKLQTDHLDLWQLHNITSRGDLDRIFGTGGALDAMHQARDQKMVRFLGVTGHYDPHLLVEALRRFEFDTVLMALNAADAHHLPFTKELLPLANARRMGVIAMKIPARGRLFQAGGITTMRDAMRYTLSQPVSTVIVGCDTVSQLEENVAIAKSFEQLGPADMARLEHLTASYHDQAAFFKRGNAGF